MGDINNIKFVKIEKQSIYIYIHININDFKVIVPIQS